MESKYPDYINDQGFKWWAHRQLTEYAKTRLGPEWSAWVVESPGGVREFALVASGNVAYSCQQLDAASMWIDIQKAAREMP